MITYIDTSYFSKTADSRYDVTINKNIVHTSKQQEIDADFKYALFRPTSIRLAKLKVNYNVVDFY